MYKYPIKDLNYFSNLLNVDCESHSMGESLSKYMEIKIHPAIEMYNYNTIIVQGLYDRSKGISSKEKSGKLFNYKRPTAYKKGDLLYINCYPGFDYVFHYANILKTYLELQNKDICVKHILPSEEECWNTILSELYYLPTTHTIILGYVEGIQELSNDEEWFGVGDFSWKRVQLSTSEGLLLGCKHTYWGEIAGRIVHILASKNVKRVIYVGKLGTLNSEIVPNMSLATGNSSILPNGEIIEWNNLFSNTIDNQIYFGKHITVPSVMQETKVWLQKNKNVVDFVDPEIGHMALAAIKERIEFSYLHIVSDNLSKKYDCDLSNERKNEVIKNREQLCEKIRKFIKNL